MAGNKLQIKRTSVPGRLPSNTDIDVGELAINLVDNRLFTKNGSNTVIDVHGQSLNTTSSVQFANVTANAITVNTISINTTSGNTILANSFVVLESYVERYSNTTVNTITVTVNSKIIDEHRYYGSGSGLCYILDGIQGPYITFVPGKTYKFDQSDASNSGHPLRFYLESSKTTAYTTNVTTSGTPGSAGAYTQIVVSEATPSILHYQCQPHDLMGNQIQVSGSPTFATVNAIGTIAGTTITGNLAWTYVTNVPYANATANGVVLIIDSISNTSATVAASANSVKRAYDLANAANTAAGQAYTNAVAYAASNTYVNTTFAPLANPSLTGVVTVSGNLIVTGSTTYVNTNIFQVSDNIVTLNADASGAPTENVGFEVNRGSSAYTYLLWDEGIDKWTFTNDGTAYFNIASNTDVNTAYSNAVAYAASNTYVNSTFAPLAGATFTGAVSGITTLAAGNTSITGFANVSSTLQVGANVILGTTTILANGVVGSAGQVLTSGAAGNVYWSTVSGGGGGSTNTFGTIVISGQTSVVADTTTDTLTLVAGSGMAITTDASTDTITFASSGSATNTFGTIAIAGQTSVVADTTTDTLTLVGGNNVTITTDDSTDTITFVANNTLFTLLTVANNSSANISLTGTSLTANTVKVIGAGGVNVNSNGSVITIDGTNVSGGGGSSNGFGTVAVSGQSDVIADQANDVLTLVAAGGMTITTNPGGDTITFTSSVGGSSNSFGTVIVSGQSDVIADQANDALTLVAGSGMTITTSPGGDTITFTSSGGGGSGTGTGTAFIAARDNFTANGTQTVFTLSTNATANSILVAVDGLIQFHTEDYGVSGTTLTFVDAPANNEVLEVLHISGASNYLFQQYAAIDSFSGNGSNTGFTLTRSANTSTAQVYLDGLLQDPNNDYTFTGTALAFTTAPLSAEAILVYHTESSSGNPHLTSISGIDTFAGDGTTTVFTLTGSANSSTSFITVNGLVQRYTTDYTLSGTTLTFVDAPPNGSAVQGLRLTGSLGVTYKTIQVSGQSDIVADQADDILTFANGAGITITTNAGTDTLTIAKSAITKQSLTGNGSNTIFTLSTSTTEDDILVFVDGTYFHPTDDYTVSTTTLTFASAPINNAEIRIRYMR